MFGIGVWILLGFCFCILEICLDITGYLCWRLCWRLFLDTRHEFVWLLSLEIRNEFVFGYYWASVAFVFGYYWAFGVIQLAFVFGYFWVCDVCVWIFLTLVFGYSGRLVLEFGYYWVFVFGY